MFCPQSLEPHPGKTFIKALELNLRWNRKTVFSFFFGKKRVTPKKNLVVIFSSKENLKKRSERIFGRDEIKAGE